MAPSYLSEAAVLLPESWQTAQWGDRGVTLAAADFSGGLTVDVIVVAVQIVVTGGSEQGAWRGQGASNHTSTVGVGGGLPERYWEREDIWRPWPPLNSLTSREADVMTGMLWWEITHLKVTEISSLKITNNSHKPGCRLQFLLLMTLHWQKLNACDTMDPGLMVLQLTLRDEIFKLQ